MSAGTTFFDSLSQPGRAERFEARRAALLVHAMSVQDQKWLLSQLSVAQQVQLGSLLSELQVMGIARDPVLLREALKTTETAPHFDPTTPRQPEDIGVQERLMEAQPWIVAKLLKSEPSALVMMVLAIASWPWREEVLAALEPSKRRQVLELLSSADQNLPIALRKVLLHSLEERISGVTKAIPKGSDPNAHERSLARIRAFFTRTIGGHA
ncbi:hypothetical protein [Variovorax terrae]|uniref:Uncharacterized protein n=1 Tax=Variovorax terrae TaxID=2923278 RepID=A0A9X2AQG4_9BURK|nr:hypothetical protein [Variovorax terrae]MCJ0764542.1 hypothetical protein [Variovorax terrae]